MCLLQKLSEMNKTNNTLEISGFTIHFSTANLGGLPNFHGGRYYDIMGENGIEGEYMTKEEVSKFLNKDNLCFGCKYYESFRDAYDGDELEPDDSGFCRGNDEKDGHTHSDNQACEYYCT